MPKSAGPTGRGSRGREHGWTGRFSYFHPFAARQPWILQRARWTHLFTSCPFERVSVTGLTLNRIVSNSSQPIKGIGEAMTIVLNPWPSRRPRALKASLSTIPVVVRTRTLLFGIGVRPSSKMPGSGSHIIVEPESTRSLNSRSACGPMVTALTSVRPIIVPQRLWQVYSGCWRYE